MNCREVFRRLGVKAAILLLCLAGIGVTAAGQQISSMPHGVTLIRAGRILDVKSMRCVENQGILIEGTSIKQVGWFDTVHSAAPKDAAFIDLSTATILPGLIDCHAHPMLAMDPNMNGADALIANLAKYSPTKRVLLGAELGPRVSRSRIHDHSLRRPYGH